MNYLKTCREMSAEICAARVRATEAFRVDDREAAQAALCQIECLLRRQASLVAAVRDALQRFDNARRHEPVGPLDPATFGKPMPYAARRALESLARLEAAEEDFRVLSMTWADCSDFEPVTFVDASLDLNLDLNRPLSKKGGETDAAF